MIDWIPLIDQIRGETGTAFDPDRPQPLSGGCISEAYRLSDGHDAFFVKVNRADFLPALMNEAAALATLYDAGPVRVPKPVCTGSEGQHAWLVLEYIALGPPRRDSEARFGGELVSLHRATGDQFGWVRDNMLGTTPQPNAFSRDWVAFWSEHRLGFQLELAASRGFAARLADRGARLQDALPDLLGGHRPVPSLLHGDLWSGNIGYDAQGRPVIYDPASYYGDREADLAMTELFGGLSREFYAAYQAAWPLDEGYPLRRTLYNLYHILNHLNLFGAGYLSQAESMLDRLLSEIS